MALPARLGYTSLGSGPCTLELWLDLLCPFSARCTAFLDSFLVPAVLPGGRYAGKLRLLIRPYPQPWHPQGGYLAESALAFGIAYCSEDTNTTANSELWFKYFARLMQRQPEFKDDAIRALSSDQIKDLTYNIAREVLVDHAAKGVDEASVVELMRDTTAKGKLRQGGNTLTQDHKYFVKLGRQNGIHVTLTAVVDGLIDFKPQSSWGEAEWTEHLA